MCKPGFDDLGHWMCQLAQLKNPACANDIWQYGIYFCGAGSVIAHLHLQVITCNRQDEKACVKYVIPTSAPTSWDARVSIN